MTGICGYMSGGKTYTAVEMLLGDLLDGNIVCTNIQLRCQGVTSFLKCSCLEWKRNLYILNDDVADCDKYHNIYLYDYNKYPCGAIRGNGLRVNVYIDEASSFFDSIEVSSSSRIKEFSQWVRHTEKRGQFIFPIVQFPSDLQKRFRQHCSDYIYCANSEKVRLPFLHLNLPRCLHGFVLRGHTSADGETVLSPTQWVLRRQSIYDCYYTAQILQGSSYHQSNVHSLNIQKESFPWRRIIFILFGMYFLLQFLRFRFFMRPILIGC